MGSNKFLYILIFTIFCHISKQLPSVKVNSNGNYELSDGTRYNTCDEYETALGENKVDGYYEKITGNKIYCLMDLSSWGIDKAYQAILIRKDGSVDFNMTWEESKVFRGNDQEMWIGLEDLHAKCGQPQSCELLIMFTTRPSTQTALVSEYLLCSDFYIDDEAGKYKNHIKQWYQSGNARLASFTYHNNRYWSTKDKDWNNCAVKSRGPNWYGSCADNTPFSPYNGSGYYGISVEQADGDGRREQYDNMDYMVFAVRQFGTGQLSTIQKGKYSINPGVWLDCDYTYCKECFESPTNCIVFCNNNCDNTGCNQDNTCKVCQEGYFKNSDQQCEQCNNQICATCTDDKSNCILQCNEGCKSCQADQKCYDCIDGYYLNGQNCITCDKKICATCTDSTTCVQSCNNNCDDQGCNIDATCKRCKDGYFQSQDSLCTICDNTICATCLNESNNCILQCNQGCQTCNIDQTCINCKDGFYLNGSQCKPCNNQQCATCTSDASTCDLSCQNHCGSQGCNVDSTCKDCVDGYYFDNTTCIQCDKSICATCQNKPNNCILACQEGCSQCKADQSCTGCKQGYYDSGSLVCTKCNSNCATCNSSADSCDLFCAPGCGYQGCNPLGKCINCENGLYLDDNQVCQECDYTICAQCNNSAQNCTKQCYEGCNECNIDRSCKIGTGCKEGFFQIDNGQCQKCDSLKCRTCNISADNCIEKCPQNCGDQGCNVSGVCLNCIPGQFLNELNNKCEQCSSKCEECLEQSDQCTKCREVENELRLPPFCVDLNSVSFENQINIQNQNSYTSDISCNGACDQCQDTTQLCQQCKDTFIMQNNRCICSSTQELVLQKCLDQCKDDEYRDYETKLCNKCKYYQDLCLNECPWDTYLDTSSNICQKKGSLDFILIYIIAGIGILLIIISLIYNKKSKSLQFQDINKQDDQEQKMNQNLEIQKQDNVIVISQNSTTKELKQEIQSEVSIIPDNNISTNQIGKLLEQNQDTSQGIQQSKNTLILDQEEKDKQNNLQQEQLLITQKDIQNENNKQKPNRKGKKRRKTQKILIGEQEQDKE